MRTLGFCPFALLLLQEVAEARSLFAEDVASEPVRGVKLIADGAERAGCDIAKRRGEDSKGIVDVPFGPAPHRLRRLALAVHADELPPAPIEAIARHEADEHPGKQTQERDRDVASDGERDRVAGRAVGERVMPLPLLGRPASPLSTRPRIRCSGADFGAIATDGAVGDTDAVLVVQEWEGESENDDDRHHHEHHPAQRLRHPSLVPSNELLHPSILRNALTRRFLREMLQHPDFPHSSCYGRLMSLVGTVRLVSKRTISSTHQQHTKNCYFPYATGGIDRLKRARITAIVYHVTQNKIV